MNTSTVIVDLEFDTQMVESKRGPSKAQAMWRWALSTGEHGAWMSKRAAAQIDGASKALECVRSDDQPATTWRPGMDRSVS